MATVTEKHSKLYADLWALDHQHRVLQCQLFEKLERLADLKAEVLLRDMAAVGMQMEVKAVYLEGFLKPLRRSFPTYDNTDYFACMEDLCTDQEGELASTSAIAKQLQRMVRLCFKAQKLLMVAEVERRRMVQLASAPAPSFMCEPTYAQILPPTSRPAFTYQNTGLVSSFDSKSRGTEGQASGATATIPAYLPSTAQGGLDNTTCCNEARAAAHVQEQKQSLRLGDTCLGYDAQLPPMSFTNTATSASSRLQSTGIPGAGNSTIAKDGVQHSPDPWASFLSGLSVRAASPHPCKAAAPTRVPVPHTPRAALSSATNLNTPAFGRQHPTAKAAQLDASSQAHWLYGAGAQPASPSPAHAPMSSCADAAIIAGHKGHVPSSPPTATKGVGLQCPAAKGDCGADSVLSLDPELPEELPETRACQSPTVTPASRAFSGASPAAGESLKDTEDPAPTPWAQFLRGVTARDSSPSPCHAAAVARDDVSSEHNKPVPAILPTLCAGYPPQRPTAQEPIHRESDGGPTCDPPLASAGTSACQPYSPKPVSPTVEDSTRVATPTVKDVDGPNAMPWAHLLRGISARDTSPVPAQTAAPRPDVPEANDTSERRPEAPVSSKPAPPTAAPSAAAPLPPELGSAPQGCRAEGVQRPPTGPAPELDTTPTAPETAPAHPQFPAHLLEAHLAASTPEIGPAPPASIAPVIHLDLPPVEVVSKYDKKNGKKRGLAKAVSALKGAVPRVARRAAKACRKGLGRLACLSGGSCPAVVGAAEEWVLLSKVDQEVLSLMPAQEQGMQSFIELQRAIALSLIES